MAGELSIWTVSFAVFQEDLPSEREARWLLVVSFQNLQHVPRMPGDCLPSIHRNCHAHSLLSPIRIEISSWFVVADHLGPLLPKLPLSRSSAARDSLGETSE